MSLDGRPRSAFGQRQGQVRARRAPTLPAAPKPSGLRPATAATAAMAAGAVLILGGLGFGLWAAPAMHIRSADTAQATQSVIDIVNQPVTHLPRTAAATVFSPGWFHDGAVKPDFAKVDVRAFQEFPYKDSRYVTSDVTPSEMFLGADLDFNAMTKLFYKDRTLPKARLSEAEMLKINRLYRQLARDDQALTAWRAAVAVLVLVVMLLAAAPVLLIGRAGTPDDSAAR